MRPPLRDDDEVTHEDPLAAATSAAADVAPPAAESLLEILDPVPAVSPIDNPFGLSPRELLFVEAFLGEAHFRAAKAYELAGYKVTGASHRANASRMLTRERVAAAIAARLANRVERLRIMDGDEALEGISSMARVDIRLVFPENSPLRKLPDEVADAIKSVTPTKYGYKFEMYDKLHARETMAKVHGKLKDVVKVEHSLEDIMARANQLEQIA